MNPAPLPGPSTWFAALTLPERLALRRRAPGGWEGLPSDRELAQRRLRRWQSEPAFRAAPELFRERLAAEGLTDEEFLHLLGIPPAAGARLHEEVPPWWREFDQREACSDAPPSADASAAEFQVALRPWLARARARLAQRLVEVLPAGPHPPLDGDGLEAVELSWLQSRLALLTTRTFVVELHAARLEGHLRGETAGERFQSFLGQLADPRRVQALLADYPVLVRQLSLALDQWVDARAEVLARLCRDWPLVAATFSPQVDPGPLTQLKGEAGDRHNGGRSVHLLTFASGLRLVYKPRSLAVDRHFQQLLAWLNARVAPPPFRTLLVLERPDYGWIEFVEPAPCTCPEEVARFYRRQGGYLALLYALHATDFHHENLIAAGEQPILIDLESLFHPNLHRTLPPGPRGLGTRVLADSVVRTGLLPYRLWASDESEGLDISGLGGAAGQLTPEPVKTWEERGLDSMHIVRKRVDVPAQANRPTLEGAAVEACAYAEEIIGGFTALYRLLAQAKDELLAPSGPLAAFANDPVRCIVRGTATYATLLAESFHPQLLRDALSRERLFDQLWVGAAQNPLFRSFIPHERADLHRGDVPVFTTRPEARLLWSSQGTAIADVVRESGMEVVRRRLASLGEEDLARQVWFVRSSLAALATGENPAPRPARRFPAAQLSAPAVGTERFLQAACRAGDRLAELALTDGDDVGWLGLSLIQSRFWTLAPAELDLYDGLAGIGLFLGYLGRLTGLPRYRDLAGRVARTVVRHLDEDVRPDEPLPIGAFGRLGGPLYFLGHAAVFTEDPGLLPPAEKLLDAIAPRIEADKQLDLIGGAAGCLVSLLVYHRCRPSERALELAGRCGEHLLAHAESLPQGLGWRTPMDSDGPLTGFSHGAAGIGWALLELATATGQERFRQAARGAFAYERSRYSPEFRNWPDLRRDPTRAAAGSPQPTFMTAWCHGAAGIGLGRLLSAAHLDDPELLREIAAAAARALSDTSGMNHSLCHGALGNLDFLLQGARAALVDAPPVDRLAGEILDDIECHGWLCGTPGSVETPGLMVGVAGIGYGLLRLAAPDRVPSVLALAPPTH
jgi:type 2 lantibiotic biosynthesis protein LanM